ncbi:RICIN domain-containing protein, partial [Glycomyces sp. L485]|uniref:RICIN domain-containing protein n=1 Tax=Glycomyces sp. L485 TaxID=2909235 RepID=UPI001F4B8785
MRLHRARAAFAALVCAAIAAACSLFIAAPAHAVETGTWYVLESRHSGLVFDIAKASTAEGAGLIQWNRTDAANQQYRFIDAGNGYHKIQVRHSGLVIDVSGKSAEDGADIVQWADNGGANQQWEITESGGYATIVNRFSGKALDVWERSTEPGARISQYDPNGGANQQWRLVPVASDDTGEDIDRAPVAVSVSGGVYLGWRLLADDPTNTAFNVYRDGQLITTTSQTDLTDSGGGTGSTYEIGVVHDGQEVERTGTFSVWGQQYLEIDMDRPAGGTTPDGVDYTYSPNDATVADLDGDGT